MTTFVTQLKKESFIMYDTTNFGKSLIQSVINFMTENRVDIFPMDFLADRDDYPSCKAAKDFYNKGRWQYFKVIDGELHIFVKSLFSGEINEYVVDCTADAHTKDDHYFVHIADLVNLVAVAYDTIGSIHFNGRETLPKK
jgi:hypothetical protein